MNQTNDTNKRIAEKCGIKPEPYFRRTVWIYDGVMHDAPPNYTESLDAMALAEATLTDEEYNRFSKHLSDMGKVYDDSGKWIKSDFRTVHSATAAQRVAAFLAVVEGRGE